MKTVNFENYGHYSSDNYGVHSLVFTAPDGSRFYFSYNTLVAFQKPGCDPVVRENIWGPTTGKHLNWIDRGNKSARVSGADFERLYNESYGG